METIASRHLPGTTAAHQRLAVWQTVFSLGAVLFIGRSLLSGPSVIRTAVISLWIALYTYNNLYRWWLAAHSVIAIRKAQVQVPTASSLVDPELPHYTILLPLRQEAPVVPQLISAIRSLAYPTGKLQILCLLKPDDSETLEALEQCGVSAIGENSPITVMLLPADLPVGTKPAACNWGLHHATGDVLVIYDAEDIPDPQQLREAAAALKDLPADVACVQSTKRVYNGETNWLTRLYELEALTWHRLQLPGVAVYEKLCPLHGSGVHFRTEVLRELNGWDYYNVAEDCDLGVRLYRQGYRIAGVDSLTGEEAPTTLRGWMGQRTRWNKGYVQTFLVHTREPFALLRELGFRRTLAFSTLTGITFLNLLIGLPTWLGAVVWSLLPRSNAEPPSGDATLLLGSAAVLLLMAALLQSAGAIVARRWWLVPYGLLTPIYWVMLGIAVWRSVWQLVFAPFGWEKTAHGHTAAGKREKETNAVKEASIPSQ